MAEANPAAARDMPEFALPDPKGEGIKQYIQRAVAYDDTFKGLAGHARYLGVEVALPGVCHPAFLTPDAVQAYYQAFDRLNQDPRAEGFWDLINHLWFGQHHLPFAVRMAQTPNPDVGEVFWTEEDKSRPWTEMLRSVRKAAHRRDSLMAAMFDALRSGKWQASGFMPGDHMRQPISINGTWWADEQVQCDWKRGEFHPGQPATPGRPTFLGITLAAPALTNVDAIQPMQSKPVSIQRQPLKKDLEIWYRDRVANWPANAGASSEKDDLAAAKGPFPSVNRTTLRKLRTDFAPATWKRPGKKSKPT